MNKLQKFILLFFLVSCGRGYAQQDVPSYKMTNEVVWLSVGHHHSYDSYLSSLLYKGTSFALGVEQSRFFSPSWRYLTRYDGYELHLTSDKNPSKNSSMYNAYVRGFYGAHLHLRPGSNVLLKPGIYCETTLGGRSLLKNSNNPANALFNTDLWLSLVSSYRLKITKKFELFFRNHFSTPFLGCMFSPKYTELYYDIMYVDEFDGNFVLTSYGRRNQFRNALSVDVPLGQKATVRLGLAVDRYKTSVNRLETRDLDVKFQIGYVKKFFNFKGNMEIPSQYADPEK